MNDRTAVTEAARRTPLLAETEVLVLGGGPAGIAAAASVTNFSGLHANVHGEMRRVVHGETGLVSSPAPQQGPVRHPAHRQPLANGSAA